MPQNKFKNKIMIRTVKNKGVQMTFNNGLTISIQFGSSNYCSNQNYNSDYNKEQKQEVTECNNAEIAIWDTDNKWFTFDGDTVKGWVSIDEVGIWIDKVRRAKNINTIKRVK